MVTWRRRAPAFGVRDRDGVPAASGWGMSLVRETMWHARDGPCTLCTFRAIKDDARWFARSLQSGLRGGPRGGGVSMSLSPGLGCLRHRVGVAAGGPREGPFGEIGGNGGG